MRKTIQFAATLLVQFFLWHGAVKAFAIDRAVQPGESGSRTAWAFPGGDSRDLPADQYVKLRATAIASAAVRPSVTVQNPMAGAGGVSLATLAVLQQQRAYLHSHSLSKGRPTPDSERDVPVFGVSDPSGRGVRRAESLIFGHIAPYCPVPTIVAVNGQTSAPVFTPQLPDNHYRIEGCGFGAVPGEVRLEPDANLSAFGSQPRPITMLLDSPASWDDNEIDVHLDSRLWGIPDWPVTLVVRAANGSVTKLPNSRFVAVREQPKLLSMITASWVKLDPTTAVGHTIGELELLSPPVAQDGSQETNGSTALVVRSDPDAFAGGEDSFDFSQLNPGWIVDRVQVDSYSVTCPGKVTNLTNSGQWDAKFTAQGLDIAWASSSCHSVVAPDFGFHLGFSKYAVKVWVVGPAGTQPARSHF